MDDKKFEETVHRAANSPKARELRWAIELAMANYRIFLEEQVGRACQVTIAREDSSANSDGLVLWHKIEKAVH